MRSFAYARLEDRTATLAHLRSYFEALPAEDRDGVQDVADLRHTLEIYHALVESGLLDQAIELCYDRLSITLFYTLGAYTTMVEVLTPLFPRGFAEPPTLTKTSGQRYAVNELAAALDALGEFAQHTDSRHRLRMWAIPPGRKSMPKALLWRGLIGQ